MNHTALRAAAAESAHPDVDASNNWWPPLQPRQPSTPANPVETWWKQAACADTDKDVFYPPKANDVNYRAIVAAAKAICATCPVRDACLEYALDNNEEFGIWGGTTASQRDQMKWKRSAPRKSRANPDRQLAPCGTKAAALRHWRHGETPCDACRKANAADKQARKREKATA